MLDKWFLINCIFPSQSARPSFVLADTMGFWISIATRMPLTKLFTRVEMLILNDGEARQFTGETSLIKAGKAIREMGPRSVAIKKG